MPGRHSGDDDPGLVKPSQDGSWPQDTGSGTRRRDENGDGQGGGNQGGGQGGSGR